MAGGDRMDLNGKAALVTGAGGGIGRAIALTLADARARVMASDVEEAEARATAELIQKAGGTASARAADVTRWQQVEGLVTDTVAELGALDVLVCSHGVFHPAVSILQLDLAEVDRIFNVNYKGVYYCCRRAGQHMVKQGKGNIVNVSSMSGLQPLPLPMYGPMKAAVNNLTRILAAEFAGFGVRVNAVAPAYVLTPKMQQMIEQGLRDPQGLLDRTPMGRMMSPEDIAQCVLFLASDASSLMTGEVMLIDGGWMADGGWSAFGGRPGRGSAG
jgi:NAD(P)-dependent dehydrogenase (short-subunit alcohol dehydrogenase family)